MTLRNKVEVRIAGKDYTLVGTESDEYMQKVALHIDKKIAEIMKINTKLSTSMASVLTALNAADEYFKTHESETTLKKEHKRLQDELERFRRENVRLADENNALKNKINNIQLELAKREAELSEVRNYLEKASKQKF